MVNNYMKLEYHAEILRRQNYSCNCCGQGCRSFLVPVRAAEREAIEKQGDWRGELKVGELFVRHRAAGKWGYGLAKRADGRCVFLDEDNLCLIHKSYGLRAKPLACQLYPFVLTPFGGRLKVGLRFDCPAVCRSEGRELMGYRKELKQLSREMVGPGWEEAGAATEIYRGRKITVEQAEAVNEAVLKILDSEAVGLADRLQWLWGFVEHLRMMKWGRVGEEDFGELVEMFRRGVFAEQQRGEVRREAVRGRGRKMLGQILFILTQPTTIITSEKEGWWKQLGKRLEMNRQMKRLGRPVGPLPKIQPSWPECELGDLEESFGDWPKEVEEMLSRYLTCRVGSMGYFGSAFYGYSMTEGIESLLLGMVTVGWVMRVAAVKAGRRQVELADAQEAVMMIDGNMGYATALGFGPGRLRLRYLREHLEGFINRYCR